MAGKPRQIKAPTSTVLGDLTSGLKAVKKAQRAPARRTSQNPARVPTNAALRLTRAPKALPTAAELLRDTAQPPLGMGQRTKGAPLPPESFPSAADLFEQTAGGVQLPGTTAEGGAPEEVEDRIDVISPPNTIEPGRPRAREARFNYNKRELTVVFRDGGTYVYYNVPSQTWRALKANRSFGQTLDRLVINVYQYEKVSY